MNGFRISGKPRPSFSRPDKMITFSSLRIRVVVSATAKPSISGMLTSVITISIRASAKRVLSLAAHLPR
jgi:hypothetical protein